ncbi:recombinase family protein [Streptomyces sp. CB01635]|uniref:recombinase family protein n=1 Tax=unclassified Streptomyces TaxID=2593676 RepID=UPI001F1A2B25|nr:recombinase family protein [Streptomyces sp. CB01635]
MKAGAPKYEDPATSSRVYAVRRAGFRELLDEAAVGDTVRIADAARLFRSTKDVIEIREVLQRRGLHLRIATGAWSGFDLAADDPQTKLFVTMLAGVLEFQRDMISENTKEGVAAAKASGKVLGRPSALSEADIASVVKAYTEEATAVKALARQHGVDPKTIRRVLDLAGARDVVDEVDQEQTERGEIEHQEQEQNPVVSIDMPVLSWRSVRKAVDSVWPAAVPPTLAAPAGNSIKSAVSDAFRPTRGLAELGTAQIQLVDATPAA